MTMKSERIAYIDLAKGICISIVMCFHIRGIIPDDCMLAPIAFSACMLPPFFFLSGLFFKEEATFGVFIKKKVERLLIPFTFFYLITAVALPNMLHYWLGMRFETVIGWPSLWAFVWPGEYPNIPLWFLLCLFVMSVLFRALLSFSKRKCQKYSHCCVFTLCFICAAIGIYSKQTFETDVAHIFTALENMPLFCLGYRLSQTDILPKFSSVSRYKLLIGLIGSFLLTLLSCVSCQSLIVVSITYYIYGAAGTALVLITAALIVHFPLISYLGRYSIIVLLTHGVMVRMGYPHFMTISATLGAYASVISFWTLMALSYLAIIPFCIRFLPHVTGQSPKTH